MQSLLAELSCDVHSDPKDPNWPAAREILAYFLRNPDAADSLVELARWRLMEEAVRRSVEKTEAALNWLIQHGYVREETRMGTERIFQLNPARRAEAERLMLRDETNFEQGSR
ncbi:MAG TPA: hypothetical protein VLW06_09210 [Terriglobales bacterium]|nr:hypothetical protein [Terriglobales bacterium]